MKIFITRHVVPTFSLDQVLINCMILYCNSFSRLSITFFERKVLHVFKICTKDLKQCNTIHTYLKCYLKCCVRLSECNPKWSRNHWPDSCWNVIWGRAARRRIAGSLSLCLWYCNPHRNQDAQTPSFGRTWSVSKFVLPASQFFFKNTEIILISQET